MKHDATLMGVQLGFFELAMLACGQDMSLVDAMTLTIIATNRISPHSSVSGTFIQTGAELFRTRS
jgi:hypothetical protein